MTTYNVTAKRWKHGWELHIAGVGVTQSRTLADADRVVRDYVATLYDLDEVTDEVLIIPDIGALGEQVRQAHLRAREASKAQIEAARESRRVARALRKQGLSVTDTAAILGVSRGRVSQLLKTG